MSQDETEAKAHQFQTPERTERHLARSLEDVSHLFLSRENPGGGNPDTLPAESTRQAPPHSGEEPLFLLKDQPQTLQRDSLASLLNANPAVLEDGLKIIDTNLSVDSDSPVDLVAVDRFNKLCLVDIDVSGSNALLLRGICHFDWFVRNVPIVRRMYRDRVIDCSAHPRVFLVAPRFSDVFQCATQRIACTRIHCYLYHIAAGSGGTGILLTRI